MKIKAAELNDLEELCVDAREAFIGAHGVYHHAKDRVRVTMPRTHSGSWPLPISPSYDVKEVEEYRLSMVGAESLWLRAKTNWEKAK